MQSTETCTHSRPPVSQQTSSTAATMSGDATTSVSRSDKTDKEYRDTFVWSSGRSLLEREKAISALRPTTSSQASLTFNRLAGDRERPASSQNNTGLSICLPPSLSLSMWALCKLYIDYVHAMSKSSFCSRNTFFCLSSSLLSSSTFCSRDSSSSSDQQKTDENTISTVTFLNTCFLSSSSPFSLHFMMLKWKI